jgi:uncharacterized protein YndB with AHSA1/START domain
MDGKRSADESPTVNPWALQLTAEGDRQIVMTRAFDAPRRLVFEAFTRPELVRKWLLGPPGWTMPICDIDLRVGGAYRYVWRHASGKEMGMGGVFREIAPPDRIVCTEAFDEPWYAGDVVNTTSFSERGGRTTMTLTINCATPETREAILKSGMERGAGMSYDRLAELLASEGVPGMAEEASRA